MPERRKFGRIRRCSPSGRYQASYTAPDGRIYKAERTFAAREDAEGWLHERRKELDRDLWSPPATADQKRTAAQKKAAGELFAPYANRWLENRTVKGRPLKPRTKAHYRSLLDDYLIPAFGSKQVRDITMQSVDRWYARTLKDKPTMRAHAYSLLRTILETARTRDRIIETNPCLVRGGGTVSRKIKPQPATLEQLAIATAAMPERMRLMVPLSAWCALRFGELVELRRSDIDVTNGVIRIRRAAVRVGGNWVVGDPKSEAGARDVAIPPHLMGMVKEHLEPLRKDDLLFPAVSGGHMQPSTLYRHWYKARDAAGRPDLRWHDLRHSGAVMAAMTGATLAELMARLGHSSPQAAMRYQHAAQGRDREIAAALSRLAEGVGS
ncbi:integrase [Mycolicibacterium conceptionense]|uniref:Integrase n=1 Tax=Mycolicibacterium conceptionense TaxID=451644 RepID=A0A0J8U406_9MYCO|nr:site-specific integrase [Mycolicibacterium conceptionense]KMV15837.1 integrase [Mycolicibacterium conceptionense]